MSAFLNKLLSLAALMLPTVWLFKLIVCCLFIIVPMNYALTMEMEIYVNEIYS